MRIDGLIIQASNPVAELGAYHDRVGILLGDQIEERACTGCGDQRLPEDLNRAGQCTKCGPADPKPVFETLEQVKARLSRKPAPRVRCSRPHHPLVHCRCRSVR